MNLKPFTKITAQKISPNIMVLVRLLSGKGLKSSESSLMGCREAIDAKQVSCSQTSIGQTYQKHSKGSSGEKIIPTGKAETGSQFAGYVVNYSSKVMVEKPNSAHISVEESTVNTRKLEKIIRTGEVEKINSGKIQSKRSSGVNRHSNARDMYVKSAVLMALLLALAVIKPQTSMSTISNLGESTQSIGMISITPKFSAHLVTELFIEETSRELLERPYSLECYNVVGNDERECLKNSGIGKSAAKPLRNEWKVQRSGYGVPLLSNQEWTVKAHERATRKRRYDLVCMETCRSGVIKKAAITQTVSPTETPVLTMCGKNKATGSNHEWLTDTLADAAANANIEGNDVEGVQADSRGRLGNYTQILGKTAQVSGTQEKVLKAGVKSEMAYQLERRMREMKRDGEFAIIGVSNPKAIGSETVAREMGSLDAYLLTNNQFAATGSSVPTGDGTDVSDYAGIDRTLTETIFNGGLQDMFTNSGGNESVNAVVSAAHKKVISSFTSAATRYVTTDDKKLVASIDVYVGDFHTARIIPDRYIKANMLYIIDPEYLKISELRPIHSYDLAKNGDAKRKQVIWEWTLEVCNEKAHCNIADLT
jgi:hypothetical protein